MKRISCIKCNEKTLVPDYFPAAHFVCDVCFEKYKRIIQKEIEIEADLLQL